MKCAKAIIPVAGYGTRRLPVSKAIEKCMLPLLNRPIIDYVVEDCLKAGVKDFYFVVGEQGGLQLKQYYSRDLQLEEYLHRTGKDGLIPCVTPPADVKFHYIVQRAEGPYGTAIPVWLAQEHVSADEHVLVMMGDQCLYRAGGNGSEAADLIRRAAESGVDCGMVAVSVPTEDVPKYGILEINREGLFKRIVEKPKVEDAPSNLNNASFYLFNKRMFEYIDRYVATPRKSEYFLTDPINEFVADGRSLLVSEAKGEYLDCGTVDGWVAANNYLFNLTK
jgi:UTP--glucose-1-phosphate uridylyltransferase